MPETPKQGKEEIIDQPGLFEDTNNLINAQVGLFSSILSENNSVFLTQLEGIFLNKLKGSNQVYVETDTPVILEKLLDIKGGEERKIGVLRNFVFEMYYEKKDLFSVGLKDKLFTYICEHDLEGLIEEVYDIQGQYAVQHQSYFGGHRMVDEIFKTEIGKKYLGRMVAVLLSKMDSSDVSRYKSFIQGLIGSQDFDSVVVQIEKTDFFSEKENIDLILQLDGELPQKYLYGDTLFQLTQIEGIYQELAEEIYKAYKYNTEYFYDDCFLEESEREVKLVGSLGLTEEVINIMLEHPYLFMGQNYNE